MKKNISRKIIAAFLITSLLVPTTSAMAASKAAKKDENHSVQKSVTELDKSQKKIEAQEKKAEVKEEVKQKVAEHKEQQKTFKADIKTKKDIIKANNTQLQSIRQEIVSKKTAIGAIIDTLTESGKVIPSDLLAAIKAQQAVLKADLKAVNSGKGTLNRAAQETENQVQVKDGEGVVKGLDNVAAKQTARINALSKLNSDLAIMLDLVQQAQSLATDPVASTPSDTTSSTDSSASSDTSSVSSASSADSSSSSSVSSDDTVTSISSAAN
jgi:chromosome segregation ATPase